MAKLYRMVHNNKPYATNADRHAAILAAKRKWYQKNKAQVQAYSKAYYANKKATLNNINATYYGGKLVDPINNINNKNSIIIGNQKYILKKITVPISTDTYLQHNKQHSQKNKRHSKRHNKHHTKHHSKHHSKRHSRHHHTKNHIKTKNKK